MGIKHSFGIKPEIPNKFKTPAPNAYNSDKSEDYLEGGINHSFGIKPEIPNKFKTPAPNAYNSDKSEDYLEGGITTALESSLRSPTGSKLQLPMHMLQTRVKIIWKEVSSTVLESN